MSEQTEERTTIERALEMWEQKGPTSLTVALITDALYGARARLAAVEALALRWRAEAAERGFDDTILTAGAADMILAALAAEPADTTR